MSKPKPDPKPIEQVAQETMEKLIRHMQTDTAEEDAKRQAARDARVKALLDKWREEGNLPGLPQPEE